MSELEWVPQHYGNVCWCSSYDTWTNFSISSIKYLYSTCSKCINSISLSWYIYIYIYILALRNWMHNCQGSGHTSSFNSHPLYRKRDAIILWLYGWKPAQKTPWPESASELYRPSDRCFLAKLVPTFADRGVPMVCVTDFYGRILGFLERSKFFFFQVALQLYSRGRVDPVPDPLLLRKSGSAGNRTRASRSVARNSDH
jgi:hypothetical protein